MNELETRTNNFLEAYNALCQQHGLVLAAGLGETQIGNITVPCLVMNVKHIAGWTPPQNEKPKQVTPPTPVPKPFVRKRR